MIVKNNSYVDITVFKSKFPAGLEVDAPDRLRHDSRFKQLAERGTLEVIEPKKKTKKATTDEVEQVKD